MFESLVSAQSNKRLRPRRPNIPLPPRAPHPICHMILVASSNPSFLPTTKAKWNMAKSLDNITWAKLPNEFKTRKVHLNMILMRPIKGLVELWKEVNKGKEGPEKPWFPVAEGHALLLEGFQPAASRMSPNVRTLPRGLAHIPHSVANPGKRPHSDISPSDGVIGNSSGPSNGAAAAKRLKVEGTRPSNPRAPPGMLSLPAFVPPEMPSSSTITTSQPPAPTNPPPIQNPPNQIASTSANQKPQAQTQAQAAAEYQRSQHAAILQKWPQLAGVNDRDKVIKIMQETIRKGSGAGAGAGGGGLNAQQMRNVTGMIPAAGNTSANMAGAAAGDGVPSNSHVQTQGQPPLNLQQPPVPRQSSAQQQPTIQAVVQSQPQQVQQTQTPKQAPQLLGQQQHFTSPSRAQQHVSQQQQAQIRSSPQSNTNKTPIPPNSTIPAPIRHQRVGPSPVPAPSNLPPNLGATGAPLVPPNFPNPSLNPVPNAPTPNMQQLQQLLAQRLANAGAGGGTGVPNLTNLSVDQIRMMTQGLQAQKAQQFQQQQQHHVQQQQQQINQNQAGQGQFPGGNGPMPGFSQNPALNANAAAQLNRAASGGSGIGPVNAGGNIKKGYWTGSIAWQVQDLQGQLRDLVTFVTVKSVAGHEE